MFATLIGRTVDDECVDDLFRNRIECRRPISLFPELPHRGQLIATGTASPVIATLKLSFYLALMIAMPVVLYQVWAFVAPGLYKKEKSFAFPLLASSIFLFYVGLADVTLSENRANGPVELLQGENVPQRYDSSLDGRLAFYVNGKVSEHWRLTASADTRERAGRIAAGRECSAALRFES